MLVTVIHLRTPILLLCTASLGSALELRPETAAAFDNYVKNTEEGFAKHFLWLSWHPREKSLVWLNQSQIIPEKVEMDVPQGSIQHWLGLIFLPVATLERAAGMALDYANYKNFFKRQIADSKLIKRDGDRFEALLRLRRRQVLPVVLNVTMAAQYAGVDPNRASIACRSINIDEAEAGYLWRLNMYWRFEQADNGVYAEIELITLSAKAGLRAERVLKGFNQNFPGEFMEGLIEGLRLGFPPNRR